MNVDMPRGFEAIAVLGQGALGKVYKAWQPKLQRHVAIKTCRLDVSAEQGQDPRRLEDEALTIARLNHPNIVALYDVIREDQAIYLIMELLDGAPVSRMISKKYPLDRLEGLVEILDLEASEALQIDRRFLKNDWVCRVGIGVARALRYAHGRGVLHRDVKPANIVVTHDRHIKLLDFSIARSQSTMGRTATGVVFGTVSYMSPEQVMNNELDERTDIYALGCTLYHAATGRLPFDDDNDITVCMHHVQKMPDDPAALNPFLSPGLAEIILRCMEKSPGNRYANAQDLEADLAAVLRGNERFGQLSSISSPEVQKISSSPETRKPEEPPAPPEQLILPPEPVIAPPPPPKPKIAEPLHRAREKKELNLEEMAAMAATEEADGPSSRPVPVLPESNLGLPSVQTGSGYINEEKSDTAKLRARRRQRPLIIAAGVLGVLAIAGGTLALIAAATLDLGPDTPANNNGNSNASVPTPDETPVDVAIVIQPTPELPILTPAPRPTPTPVPTPMPTPEPTLGIGEIIQPVVPTPAPGINKFRVPLPGGHELIMVELPAGKFLMGSPTNEPGRRNDEGPQSPVTVSFPFYISDTEVTANQYRAVMGADAYPDHGDLPVENISWQAAEIYCRRISDLTGIDFQLPTEAQWEYAARAGASDPFAFGVSLTGKVANIDGTVPYPHSEPTSRKGAAAPVRSYPPNAWQIYDLHGNVAEYVRDWYDSALPGVFAADPTGPTNGKEKVVRGGNYQKGAADARASARMKVAPDQSNPGVGFRVVVEL